eukprot:15474288-Alexandrium_andersonii.AAC.1
MTRRLLAQFPSPHTQRTLAFWGDDDGSLRTVYPVADTTRWRIFQACSPLTAFSRGRTRARAA